MKVPAQELREGDTTNDYSQESRTSTKVYFILYAWGRGIGGYPTREMEAVVKLLVV